MKRFIRLLSVSLAAILLLSAAGVSFAADDTTVYIPHIIKKLGLPDMPDYITLKTKTDRAVMKNSRGQVVYQTETWYNDNGVAYTTTKYDYNGNPIPVYGTTEGADITLQFSEKPDWAGVIWATGYETLTVDDSGMAETSMVGHNMQPGINIVKSVCDPLTGELLDYQHDGGDYAYLAGKGNVAVQYGRSGSVNYVEYTVQEDFFKTGMSGASTVIRWEPVQIATDCYKEAQQGRCSYIVWENEDPITYLPDDGLEDPTLVDSGRTDSFVTNQWGNLAYDDDGNICCYQNGKTTFIPVDGTAIYDKATNRIYDAQGNVLMILPEDVCCCDKPQEIVVDPNFPSNYPQYVQIPVCVRKDATPLTVWYISRVTATYPSGNNIVEVEADWRNDEKKTLASYKITYEPKQGELYKITYSPTTTTMFEDHQTGTIEPWGASTAPSTSLEAYIKKNSDPGDRSYINFRGMYLHHYTEDEVLSGLYTSGNTVLCSGSGNNLRKWYKFNGTTILENGMKRNNLGKQVKKNGLKPCTSFISPRVVD